VNVLAFFLQLHDVLTRLFLFLMHNFSFLVAVLFHTPRDVLAKTAASILHKSGKHVSRKNKFGA
jgi:hypothetical protein